MNGRAVALDLLQDAYEHSTREFPYLNALDLSTDVEEAGRHVRDWLGMSVELQTRLKNRNEAFNAWRTAIEIQNVLVFEIRAHRYSLPINVAS